MSFTADLDALIAANSNGLLAIHSSWTRVRLTDVADILNGAPFESARFSKDTGVPLLRIRDVSCVTTDTRYDGEFDPSYWVEPGELIVGMDGDFKSGLWRGPRALLNQRVCKITPDERFCLRRFLAFALPSYLSAINDHTSSVTVKHLSSRTVGDIPIPLPPLAEQRRIVDALETQLTRLDAAVATLERVRANLKRYRAAVLQAAVEGRLPGGTAEWSESAFSDVVADSLIGLVRNSEQQSSAPPGAPYIKMNNLRLDGSIDLSELRYVDATPAEAMRYAVSRGDILFNTRNSLELVAKSAAVASVPARTVFNNNIMRIRAVPGVNPRFLALQMRSRFFTGQMDRIKRATTSVAAVYAKDLFTLRVRIPPITEQRRIADEVEIRESVAQAAERLVAAIEHRIARLRQSLLRLAFSGRLVPQDPRDEPAAALLDRSRRDRGAAVSSSRTAGSRHAAPLRVSRSRDRLSEP